MLKTESIHEAQVNVARLQTVLDETQKVLHATEVASDSVHRARTDARKLLRTVVVVAVVAGVVAAVARWRRSQQQVPADERPSQA